MLEKRALSNVLARALARGGDFAEIYIEEKRLSNVLCEDNKIERINSGREKGAGIRVIKDGNTAYVHTNDLSEEGLLKAAELATHAAGSAYSVDRNINLSLKPAEFNLDFLRLPEEVELDGKN